MNPRQILSSLLFTGLLATGLFFAQPSFAIDPIADLPNLNNNVVKAPQLKIPIPGMPAFSDVAPSKGNLANSWIAEYLIGIYRYGIGIIGVLAVIMIAVGGVKWIISQGNPSKIGEAKDNIFGALTGLTLAMGSYLLLSMINTDLVNFRPLSIDQLEKPEFTSSGGTLTGPYTGKPTFSNNNNKYDSMLRQAANQYGIDCNIVKAIMMTESNGNPKATSKDASGKPLAKGLMQIIDSTFSKLAVGSDPYDPQTSLNAGAKYLAQLQNNACNGASSNSVGCVASQLKYMAAAYNGGPKANSASTRATCSGKTAWECPENWDKSRSNSFLQTYNYVGKVQANYNQIISNNWGC